MKKINKNYYKIYIEHFCSVFLDEFLMKKANSILYKYRNEMESLLENNKDHLIEENWSLAYPNNKQTTFYGINPKKQVTDIQLPKFYTKKVENLFDIEDKDIHSDEVIEGIKKILES